MIRMIMIKSNNNNNDNHNSHNNNHKHKIKEYCLIIKNAYLLQKCKKHTGNTFPKKLVLISKNKIKGKSKCKVFY